MAHARHGRRARLRVRRDGTGRTDRSAIAGGCAPLVTENVAGRIVATKPSSCDRNRASRARRDAARLRSRGSRIADCAASVDDDRATSVSQQIAEFDVAFCFTHAESTVTLFAFGRYVHGSLEGGSEDGCKRAACAAPRILPALGHGRRPRHRRAREPRRRSPFASASSAARIGRQVGRAPAWPGPHRVPAASTKPPRKSDQGA